MLNLWDILFLPSDLGLSPSAKIWRKCTAPLGILRKSTVAFRIIQYIDRSFSFLPHLFSKKPKKSAKHSICASLGGTRSWPCSLLCCSQPSWCPSVPQLAASCPCPAHAAWHYPLQCFFFFGVCLKQHVPAWRQRVRYALQVEVSLPRETLTLYRPQISVMSPTTAPEPLTALNESH